MNIAQGLFRLWLVGSFLYMLLMGVVFYSDTKKEFAKASMDWADAGILLVPIDCREARGAENVDYTVNKDGRDWALCWYEAPKFRKQFPEIALLSDQQLSDRYYAKAGVLLTPARPWTALGLAASVALIPPLSVFVLGWLLIWAFRGFLPK